MRRTRAAFYLLLIIGAASLVAGILLGQSEFTAIQMTYGNFDLPGRISFVNRLAPGLPDSASGKIYRFDRINWHPFVLLVLVLFPLLLVLRLFIGKEHSREKITRGLTQWLVFVAARIGVLRVSGIHPISRSCFGVFPFLNCQACEMATGACPIGKLQNLLYIPVFPFYLLGLLILFGLALGRSICGWICPFGLISDIFDRFGKHVIRIPRSWSGFRYWILAVVIFGGLVFPVAGITDRNFFCSTICASGKILGIAPYYLTTASDDFFPAFRWHEKFPVTGFTVYMQVGLTLTVLLAMFFVSGRFFCRVICPLGGFWGLFNNVSLTGIKHNDSACVSCGACESVCPMGVSRNYSGFHDRTSCLNCGRCVSRCPVGARSFRFGITEMPVHVRRMDSMASANHAGFRGFYNKCRRELYLFLLGMMEKTPLEMAQYAFNQTEFYRRHYGGVNPADFSALPILTKQQIGSADPYDILSVEMRDKVCLYGETTGSTGYPTPVFYTPREFGAARVFSCITPYVSHIQEILENNRAVLNGLTFGFTIAGMSFGDLMQYQGAMVSNAGSRSTIATPERTARAIARLKPSIITGTPIDFLCWMKILMEDYPKEYPEVLEHLRMFMSTAELCSSSRCRAIEREFNLTHIDVYACVEGFFTIPCPCGEKHVLPMYHTELFDERMSPATSSGEGRLAFTNLVKKSSPLIRYLLDDFVSLYPSQCPYGFTKSIEPHGRYELSIVLEESADNPSASRRYGTRHFEEALFLNGLFGDYRVKIDDEKIHVSLEEFGSHKSAEQIETALESEFKRRTVVEIVPFGTITKYREVRRSKPILKVEDRRARSTQRTPEFL